MKPVAARLSWLLLVGLVVGGGARAARAAEPALAIVDGEKTERFTTSALLARPDAKTLTVAHDVSYRKTMSYRAIPFLALLGPGALKGPFDTLEIKATDGFMAQLPLKLIADGAAGGSVAWLAVEDPAHPWPVLPEGKKSAGPFYLVWEQPQRSGVRSEQWPYAMMSVVMVESPVKRWPQLAVPAASAADATLQAGQQVFFSLCLPCHQLNGGGAGHVGPDLGRPMNATQYMSEAGLRALIRDPRAVRTWPNQQMTGFGTQTLPDTDLDALIAYLRAQTRQPTVR